MVQTERQLMLLIKWDLFDGDDMFDTSHEFWPAYTRATWTTSTTLSVGYSPNTGLDLGPCTLTLSSEDS